MQLTIISLLFCAFLFMQDMQAQVRKFSFGKKKISNRQGDTTEVRAYEVPEWQTVEVNFLTSYYVQDGNNAAVTGGIGTEQLTDFTQKIVISAPLKEHLTLNLDAGYDYYSSASTDNIDNVRSSDSSSDIRTHGNAGLTWQQNQNRSIGLRIGGSSEYDYYSFNIGVNTAYITDDENTTFYANAQAFIDRWAVIFPSELRRSASVATSNRRSYNASLGVSRVINKRMQASLQLETTYMQGLLSTPFHRVYFQEQSRAKIEHLPDTRLKIPMGLRLNAYLSEHLIARTYYRYYWDSWGIQAHTVSVELAMKINRFLAIVPFYRYHTQSASDYFKAYKEHSLSDTFYTSDYDLSGLSSHAYGVEMSYSPAAGLAKINLPLKQHPQLLVKSIDLKYSHYDRSTGLKADIVSMGLSISF